MQRGVLRTPLQTISGPRLQDIVLALTLPGVEPRDGEPAVWVFSQRQKPPDFVFLHIQYASGHCIS